AATSRAKATATATRTASTWTPAPSSSSGWARGSDAPERGVAPQHVRQGLADPPVPLPVPVRVVREGELAGRRGRDHAGAVQAGVAARGALRVEPPQLRIRRAGLAAVGDQEGPQGNAARPRLPLHGLDQPKMVAEAEAGARRQPALEIVRGPLAEPSTRIPLG